MAVAEELDHVEVDHLARVGAARHQAPVGPQAASGACRTTGRRRVDDRVDAAPAGQLPHGLEHVDVAVRQHVVGAERRARARPCPRRPPWRSRARRRGAGTARPHSATPPDADGTSTVSSACTGRHRAHHAPRRGDDALRGGGRDEVVRRAQRDQRPRRHAHALRVAAPAVRAVDREAGAEVGPPARAGGAGAARVLLERRHGVADARRPRPRGRPRRPRRRTRRPSTQGKLNGQRDVPARESRSEWLRPHACTATTTSSGAGTGSGTSSQRRTSGPPYARKVAARMSAGPACRGTGWARARPARRAWTSRARPARAPCAISTPTATPSQTGTPTPRSTARGDVRHAAAGEHERLGAELLDRALARSPRSRCVVSGSPRPARATGISSGSTPTQRRATPSRSRPSSSSGMPRRRVVTTAKRRATSVTARYAASRMPTTGAATSSRAASTPGIAEARR